jgi:hypothetical protein
MKRDDLRLGEAFTVGQGNVATAEKRLNAAIHRARVGGGVEEYLEIFDSYYAEDIQVSGETSDELIKGKTQVRALLLNFLMPLHIVIEVGNVDVFVEYSAAQSDVENETQSAWSVRFVARSGRSSSLKWRACRKWRGDRVIYEHHHDCQQSGGPLTFEDLQFPWADFEMGPN